MNPVQIAKAKNHIRKHRAKYAAATTLTACVYVHYRIARQWNKYLEVNDLLDDFYAEED